MTKKISKNKEALFEQIKHIDENGLEYWLARQFAKALGYANLETSSK